MILWFFSLRQYREEIRRYRSPEAWFASSSSKERIEQQLYRMDSERRTNNAGRSRKELQSEINRLKGEISRLKASKNAKSLSGQD
jgi:hypothetical protein